MTASGRLRNARFSPPRYLDLQKRNPSATQVPLGSIRFGIVKSCKCAALSPRTGRSSRRSPPPRTVSHGRCCRARKLVHRLTYNRAHGRPGEVQRLVSLYTGSERWSELLDSCVFLGSEGLCQKQNVCFLRILASDAIAKQATSCIFGRQARYRTVEFFRQPQRRQCS